MGIIEKNTVPAKEQTAKNAYIVDNGGNYNVLFLGNSITWHGPKEDIGWTKNCGMAASAKEKDYVHVAVGLLEQRFGKVNYAVVSASSWESAYYRDDVFENFEVARNFPADVIVIRLGENLWSASEHFSTHPISLSLEKLIEYICGERKPKVIVTDLFWKNQLIDEEIHLVAEKKAYAFVSINDLGEREENMAIGQYAHAGICYHPNYNGM